MTHLAKLQQQFQNRVLLTPDADTPAWISRGGRAHPRIQLRVYSYAYRARLKEVLAKDFPALQRAIGDEAFEQLADTYIDAHPSHHYSLREFGSLLPHFIRRNADPALRPWLYELANFEWALCAAFDAPDAPCLSEQVMAGVAPADWPGLCFSVHPTVQRLGFQWNIPFMWQVLTSDTPTEVTAQGDDKESHWLIWREQLVVRYRSLEDDEQVALDILCAGGRFDEICTALAAFYPVEQVPLRAASMLKTWIGQGLIKAFSI